MPPIPRIARMARRSLSNDFVTARPQFNLEASQVRGLEQAGAEVVVHVVEGTHDRGDALGLE